jgi:dipeptidyl aminopeptidase/acylaminoacyl peptidase
MGPDGISRWRYRVARLGVAVLGLCLAWWAWRLAPYAPRATLPEGIEVLCLTPDGQTVVAWEQGRLCFRDLATGGEVGRVAEELAGPARADFKLSPDGALVAATSAGVVKVWEVPAGGLRAALPASAHTWHWAYPTFSPDGKWLAFLAEGPNHAPEVRVWDLRRGREQARIAGRASAPVFSPDGQTLAFESWGEGEGQLLSTIRVVDVPAGRETRPLKQTHAPLRALAFSPDGRALAAGERHRQLSGAGDRHRVQLWGLSDGFPLATWPVPGGVRELRFSADGHLLALTDGASGGLTVFDPTAADNVTGPLPTSGGASPDGRLHVCLAEPPTIFELPTANERARLRVPGGQQLFRPTFSPDSALVAVMGVRPPPGWNRRDPLLEWVFGAGPDTPPPPPGRLTTSTMYVCRADDGSCVAAVPVTETSPVWFVPDGGGFIVYGARRTPTIWDLPPRTPWGSILPWWAAIVVGLTITDWALRRRARAAPSRPAESTEDALPPPAT